MSNDRPIYVVTKKQQSDQNDKTIVNTLRIYITINHTYLPFYSKRHIQMMSTDNTIYVKTKNNRMNKITKLHSIHLKFTLQINHRYLLYIENDTFK